MWHTWWITKNQWNWKMMEFGSCLHIYPPYFLYHFQNKNFWQEVLCNTYTERERERGRENILQQQSYFLLDFTRENWMNTENTNHNTTESKINNISVHFLIVTKRQWPSEKPIGNLTPKCTRIIICTSFNISIYRSALLPLLCYFFEKKKYPEQNNNDNNNNKVNCNIRECW